jgi:pimeloyl-ACP methyl ester carboxylesterase
MVETMTSLSARRRPIIERVLPSPVIWHDVSAAGVHCEAFETGSGPTLVFSHGGLDSCAQWLPILPALSEQFRCVAIERPNNGASGEFAYENHTGDPRAHMAEVMLDLWDGLRIERAPVIANSMGGLFTLAFAAAHPDRVDHLVLVGAPAGSEDHPLPRAVRGLVTPALSWVVERLMERSTPKSTRKFFGQDLVVHPERLDDATLDIAAATARVNARRWRRFAKWVTEGGQVRPDVGFDDIVAAVNAPTTIVWGDKDAFATPDAGRDLAAKLDAELHLVADAGHLPWYDDPDTVASATLRALGASGSGA